MMGNSKAAAYEVLGRGADGLPSWTPEAQRAVHPRADVALDYLAECDRLEAAGQEVGWQRDVLVAFNFDMPLREAEKIVTTYDHIKEAIHTA